MKFYQVPIKLLKKQYTHDMVVQLFHRDSKEMLFDM